MEFVLEACVDSVESAQAAQAGGATRYELCANLIIGGTTPDPFLFERVQACCTPPVHVLIRPRFGDFLYTDEEFELMCRQAAWFAGHGARAVVIGVLTAEGELDRVRMARLIDAARSVQPDCKVTLHRAFDVCRDPFAALEDARALGVDTILTSGQAASCAQGAGDPGGRGRECRRHRAAIAADRCTCLPHVGEEDLAERHGLPAGGRPHGPARLERV